jgi:hypothetical protein
VSTGKAVVLLLLCAGIAVVAWQAGRATERRAASAGEGAPPSVTEEQLLRAAPSAPAPLPEAGESEATFEVPILEVDERPTVAPDPPTVAHGVPPEDRPPDTTARCLMLQAYPSTVAAYGRSGEVVQLVVRAQNGTIPRRDRRGRERGDSDCHSEAGHGSDVPRGTAVGLRSPPELLYWKLDG